MKGGKSNAEADNVLHKKKAPGLKLLLKACEEKCNRPANSILRSRLSRRGKPRRYRDPEKPKQPLSAFFLFMQEFRKQLGEKNPVIHDVCNV
ncbi:hypothetical protein HAX54_026557, partial [Datura stramonium]|nr:hypothetical protein [Datura stramonium]